jgi:cytochrome c biogenesis factor
MKIIEFFKNWFQKNGLIKILAAFVLLIISALVVKNADGVLESIFNVVGLASFGYLILTVLVFTIAGIVNTIKDRKR